MEVRAFLLADHAEAVNGKLYLMGGGWDRLFVSAFPSTHPHMSVATLLSVGWQETNDQHRFQLRLLDADGQELPSAHVEGQFELGRPPGMRPGDDSQIPIVFGENTIVFERPGTYVFELSIDGSVEKQLSFRVAALQAVALTT